ncbi:hypothetical protein DIPPA_06169 [Diplonema papillatum]|nr:hypothetical protein DIPPA_35584 [Diplonema papillatum]KAJ9466976.1 hypothetical protein DIPPA_06169 [Diplonema papillatum]
MRVVIPFVAAFCAVAAVDDRVEFSLRFTDKGSVLHAVPLGPKAWAEVEESEIQLEGKGADGMFHGMQAKCVAMTPAEVSGQLTKGWCAFEDPAGSDTLVEYYEGTIGQHGGRGTAVFHNGTGKYAGLVSEHTWEYAFTSQSEDRYEGQGTKRGTYWFVKDECSA